MKTSLAVFRREFAALIGTPIGPIFIVVFLVLSSALAFTLGGFFERGRADLSSFFVFHPWLMLVLAPAIAMRLWAEERRTGTDELLLTLPVPTWAAVFGKFVAAWATLALAIALTGTMWLSVALLGEPDHGSIATGYLGSVLLGGAFLAVGSACSAATRAQVVSFILATIALLTLVLVAFPPVAAALPGWATPVVNGTGAIARYDALARGVVEGRDLLYFGSMIAAGLATTASLIHAGRARTRRVGLVVGFWVGFVLLNTFVGPALRHVRLDLTDGRVFTLGDASRAIARSPDETVTLTLYSSPGLGAAPAERRRVAWDLVREFARVSSGRVRARLVEPEAFSPEEDEAMGAGLRALPIGAEPVYLGLVATNAVGRRAVLPNLLAVSDRLLEYELARTLRSVAQPTRARIGVISALPGFGAGEGVGAPAYAGLSTIAELVPIEPDADALPEGLDALLLVQPRFVSESMRRALDAWVVGGRPTLLTLDPLCHSDRDPGGNAMLAAAAGQQGELFDLADAWGITATADALVADPSLAEAVDRPVDGRPERVRLLTWLGLDAAALNASDPATAGLERVVFASSSAMAPRDGSVQSEPLVRATADAAGLALARVRFGADPRTIARAHEPGGVRLTLGVRVTGGLRSAYDAPASDAQNLVVLGDADWLASPFWLAGAGANATPTADNGSLLLNIVDTLTGGSELLSLRSRGRSSRPLSRLEAIRGEAEQRFRSEEAALVEAMADAQARMQTLAAGSPAGDGAGLSPEQRDTLERARDDVLDARRRLREVRLELDRALNRVRTNVTLANTLIVPGSVAVAAGLLAFGRASRRRGRKERA